MKQITIALYTFNELPEDVQQKVLDEYRDINVDYDWYTFIFDEWKTTLEKNGFNSPEIHFSGFCSQGDGACFDCLSIDPVQFVRENVCPSTKLYKRAIRIQEHLTNNCSFTVQKNSYGNYYSNSNTRYIDVEHTTGDCSSIVGEIISEIVQLMEEVRKQTSDEIYRQLEREYEYQTSDEAVKDTILANEYTFESNGTMRNV